MVRTHIRVMVESEKVGFWMHFNSRDIRTCWLDVESKEKSRECVQDFDWGHWKDGIAIK